MLSMNAGTTTRLFDKLCRLFANRMPEGDVCNQSLAEECIDAMARAVDELLGNNEIKRTMLFLQRSDSRQRNDALHAKLLESVDVGAEVQLGRHQAVPATVA